MGFEISGGGNPFFKQEYKSDSIGSLQFQPNTVTNTTSPLSSMETPVTLRPDSVAFSDTAALGPNPTKSVFTGVEHAFQAVENGEVTFSNPAIFEALSNGSMDELFLAGAQNDMQVRHTWMGEGGFSASDLVNAGLA